MIFASILVLLVLFGLTTSAVLAFWWAAEDGQFQNTKEAATTIFDADEPIGRSTDHFPKTEL